MIVLYLCFVLASFHACGVSANAAAFTRAAERMVATSPHTNNWVVLVETSRFWFNYRHPGEMVFCTLSFCCSPYSLLWLVGVGVVVIVVVVVVSSFCACRFSNRVAPI